MNALRSDQQLGFDGIKGEPGDPGERGPQGQKGEKGDIPDLSALPFSLPPPLTGERGEPGIKGEPGVGVSNSAVFVIACGSSSENNPCTCR